MTRRRASELFSLAGDELKATVVPLAVDGLKATKTAILTTAGAIVLVAFTWWGAIAIAQPALNTEILALEVGAVTVLMLLTAGAVWWAFTERRVSQSLRAGRRESAVRTLMVAAFAVASFASLTSLLYLEGTITISEPVAREDAIFEFQVVYAWHLFDTVPLLDIPQNLEWELPFEFEDSLGGLLLILFTAIVILPLIRVVRVIWVGHREPYEEALLASLRSRKDWKTTKLRGEGGYERAVVRTVTKREERILVDVMRDVANADAPLNRLRFVREELAWTLAGYLLVADAVAEQARDRIESAFAKSELPAALAVWRSDQPAVDLTRAVEALFERIDSARPS